MNIIDKNGHSSILGIPEWQLVFMTEEERRSNMKCCNGKRYNDLEYCCINDILVERGEFIDSGVQICNVKGNDFSSIEHEWIEAPWGELM